MRALVHQVVTFAETPFGGNPAYVLTAPAGFDERLFPRVCDQLQAGVLAVLGDGTSGRRSLGFVTAFGAHDGAGHAAHAAAHVALPGDGAITFDLPGGQTLEAGREDGRVWVRWPRMAATAVPSVEPVGRALGRNPLEVFVASFGYVALFESADDLAALHPDLALVRALDRGAVIATAPGVQADFALRVFAPKLGLPEDPVCGTAHRIIAPHWARLLDMNYLRSRQMSPRGGDLWCSVEESCVVIAGASVLFLEGALTVAR